MTIYLLLFVEFFKTGLFAVGGGLATLPFLYDLSLIHICPQKEDGHFSIL